MLNLFLNKSNINMSDKYSQLSNESIERLIDVISNFNVKIEGYKSFGDSQVCMGGVNTLEVNPLTMESYLVKDLYIVGEIVDVDGDCGGYNLGFCWQSGIKAGRSGIRMNLLDILDRGKAIYIVGNYVGAYALDNLTKYIRY